MNQEESTQGQVGGPCHPIKGGGAREKEMKERNKKKRGFPQQGPTRKVFPRRKGTRRKKIHLENLCNSGGNSGSLGKDPHGFVKKQSWDVFMKTTINQPGGWKAQPNKPRWGVTVHKRQENREQQPFWWSGGRKKKR